jgi:hypothetical protein
MSDMIEDILDECIDRIVTHGDTVEECLARYPERVEELEPLLRAAVAAVGGYEAEPRAEFQRAAKSRFLNAVVAARGQDRQRGRWHWGWGRGWAVTAVVVLALLIMGSGTVGASTNSLPGDLLYPVKRAAENVQAFFTFGNEARANLYVKFAERRVAELRVLAAEQDEVAAAVARMGDQTRKAIQLASENGSFSPEVVERILRLTSSESSVLRGMVETAPARVRLLLREALVRSEMAHKQALVIWSKTQGYMAPESTPGDSNRGQSEEPAAPGEATPTVPPSGNIDGGAQGQDTSGSGGVAPEASQKPQDQAPAGGLDNHSAGTGEGGHNGPAASPAGQQESPTDKPVQLHTPATEQQGPGQSGGAGFMP